MTTFTYSLSASHTGSSSGTDITAAKLSLDGVISRVDGEQDHGGSDAGTVLQSYSYLGLDTIVQEVDSNGMELTYIHQSGDTLSGSDGGDRYTGLDRFGRVVDQWWYDPSTSTTLERLQYGYDRDGNVLYINNLVTSSQSELFHANSSSSGDDATAYDGLNRLTSFERGTLSASTNNGSTLDTVASPSTSQSWSLDAIGNWTADTGGANGSETRTSNADNEIVSSNGTANESPTYDHNGNMTYDGSSKTYTYDAWNRLMTVNQSGSLLEGRSYYADVEMGFSADYCGGVNTDSYYSSDWQVLEDDTSASSGMNKIQYVWGQGYLDQLVARDDNSTSGSIGLSGSGLGRRIFAVQDVNHDATALVDTSASVLDRFTYAPYGSYTPNSYGWLYQFQGGRVDPISGLYNFRNRDYNCQLGVWIEQDPAGYRAGSDMYTFDASSPVDLNDPSGLAPTSKGGMVMGPASNYVVIDTEVTISHENHGFSLDGGHTYSIGMTKLKYITFKYKDPSKNIKVYGPTTGGGIIPGAPYWELGGAILTLAIDEFISYPNVNIRGIHGWDATNGHGVPYVMLHESMHAQQALTAVAKELDKIQIPIQTIPNDKSSKDQAHAESFFQSAIQSKIGRLVLAARRSIVDNYHFYDEVKQEWNQENADYPVYGGSSFS